MNFRLLAISPGPLDNTWFSQLVRLLPLENQLGLLYRDTLSNTNSYFQKAQQLAKLCQSAHIAFFVHRRLDIALALHAHLHLPSDGLKPAQARPLLPQNQLLSFSVHNEEEAQQAHGADFALVSPVFTPGSKPEKQALSPLYPQGFFQLAQQLPCPAWALGGINPERAQLLKKTPSPASQKLAGIAVVSALWQADDPLHMAKALLASLDTP